MNSGTCTASPEPVMIPGDVNGDKKLDLSDVIKLHKHLAKAGDIIIPENADMNGDGKVNVIDLMILKRNVL